MLRGGRRTLEQATGANGNAMEQVRRADEFGSSTTQSERVLVEQSDANTVGVNDGDADAKAARVSAKAVVANGAPTGLNADELVLSGAQLYSFVPEKAGESAVVPASAQGGDIGGGVELPPDPLDPTWGRSSDMRRDDRTLLKTKSMQQLAADFDALPARFLKSASVMDNAFDLPLQHHQRLTQQQQEEIPMVLVAGGLLAFAVAGVVVNHVRRRVESEAKKKKKLKTFDDDLFDDDDEDGARDGHDGDRVYALFS